MLNKSQEVSLQKKQLDHRLGIAAAIELHHLLHVLVDQVEFGIDALAHKQQQPPAKEMEMETKGSRFEEKEAKE